MARKNGHRSHETSKTTKILAHLVRLKKPMGAMTSSLEGYQCWLISSKIMAQYRCLLGLDRTQDLQIWEGPTMNIR